MARESQRRRDERRYGKPERLADMILAWGLTTDPGDWVTPEIARQMATDAHRVLADELLSLCAAFRDRGYPWQELPRSRPGFPLLLIEFGPPGVSAGFRFGGFVSEVQDIGYALDRLRHIHRAGGMHRTGPAAAADHQAAMFAEIERRGRACILHRMAVSDPRVSRVFHLSEGLSFVDEGYRPVGPPSVLLSRQAGDLFGGPSNASYVILGLIFHVLLSLSWLNTRNVVTRIVEPDAKLNRERRKAGLRPFVQYVTIDVGPYREAFQTLGLTNPDTLVAGDAPPSPLSDVIGHFALYTESKPMFGDKDKFGLYWKPPHKRGHSPAGIVLSEHRLRPGAEPTLN